MDYRVGYVQHAVVGNVRADDVVWHVACATVGWLGAVTSISRAELQYSSPPYFSSGELSDCLFKVCLEKVDKE